MDLYKLGIEEAGKAIDNGDISPVELVNSVFERIDSVEDKVKAYVTLGRESAIEEAKQAEGVKRDNQILLGIPIAIKDNICTEGFKTTCPF